MELIALKDRVKYLLEAYPKTRENDNHLLALIWKHELSNIYEHASSGVFFNALMNGELTSSESIRRNRQKMQEIYPELRGLNYRGRQIEQQNVKDQLLEINLDKNGEGYKP